MPHRQLTRCELELMEIIWNLGNVTVQDVVDQLNRSLAYTTVMSTMNTLESRDVIRRTGKRGRAYVYEPVVDRSDVEQSMTRELTGTLFGGSVKSLVLNLLGSHPLNREDIQELKSAIQQLEAEA